MCRIHKLSYNNGSVIIEISATRELNNCAFELYIFDFLKGAYSDIPNIRQIISQTSLSHESGIYRFKYDIPGNCKIKCVVSDGNNVLLSKDRYIGERHKIKFNIENSEIGYLYKFKSDISVSKKLIYYKSPVSKTKINLPGDILVDDTLVFTIKSRDFRPKFECVSEFAECFNIEG